MHCTKVLCHAKTQRGACYWQVKFVKIGVVMSGSNTFSLRLAASCVSCVRKIRQVLCASMSLADGPTYVMHPVRWDHTFLLFSSIPTISSDGSLGAWTTLLMLSRLEISTQLKFKSACCSGGTVKASVDCPNSILIQFFFCQTAAAKTAARCLLSDSWRRFGSQRESAMDDSCGDS